MVRVVALCCLVALAALFAAGANSCEPCNDPSQLWCPDEW